MDRPRERLRLLGPHALTTAELMAILLGTGAAGASARVVAEALLSSTEGSLARLARREPAELAEHRGVGWAKAARVVAAFELGRRLASEDDEARTSIRTPADVHRAVGPRLRDLRVEEFHLLALDSQARLLRDVLVTRGTLNSSLVHPREVFRAAIVESAAGVIVVHNHPSGDPTPSSDDEAITRQLADAGRLLDIPVYDHVIIGGNGYVSFAERGLL